MDIQLPIPIFFPKREGCIWRGFHRSQLGIEVVGVYMTSEPILEQESFGHTEMIPIIPVVEKKKDNPFKIIPKE